MRKLLTIGAVVLLAACAAHARPRQIEITAATGTNNAATATEKRITGYIDEIVLELPTGATSAVVAVKVTQPMGNEITLASHTITETTLVRPRLAETTAAGAAGATTNAVNRYLSLSDTWTLTIGSADPTGKVWRAWIKYDDGR